MPLAIERLAGPGLLGRILPLQSFADDIQGPADEPSVVRALGTWCVGRKYGEIRLLKGKLLQTIGLFGAYVFRRAVCAASFRSRSYCLRRFESFGRKDVFRSRTARLSTSRRRTKTCRMRGRAVWEDDWKRIHQTCLHALGNLTLTGDILAAHRPRASKMVS